MQTLGDLVGECLPFSLVNRYQVLITFHGKDLKIKCAMLPLYRSGRVCTYVTEFSAFPLSYSPLLMTSEWTME